MKNILHIILLMLLPLSSAWAQKNILTISGEVIAEKTEVETIRILIIEMNKAINDTVQLINLSHKKYRNRANYNVNLLLDKQYKLIFTGDTCCQQTRYFDISTKIPGRSFKNYSIKDISPFIWMMPDLRKEGDIYFDVKDQKFIYVKEE